MLTPRMVVSMKTWLGKSGQRSSADKRMIELGGDPMDNSDPLWNRIADEFEYLNRGKGTKNPTLDMVGQLVADVPDNPRASARDIAEWVFAHAFNSWENIDVSAAPNRGAVGLLAWVKMSPVNYGEFVRTIWSKMLPSKSEVDSEARFSDDGRKQLRLLDEFEASLQDEPDRMEASA